MKLSILLSSAILFATALTPMSAYADDSNLMCRRLNCDTHNSGSGKISISGLDVSVKSSDRGNRNRNTEVGSNTNQNEVNTDTNDNSVDDNTNTADIDNNTDNNNDNDVDADNGIENDTNPVADNNSSIQNNSNDIEGFDPFGGLYGPGT